MEQAVGMSSVAQIFKEHSEAFFRDSEVILGKCSNEVRKYISLSSLGVYLLSFASVHLTFC